MKITPPHFFFYSAVVALFFSLATGAVAQKTWNIGNGTWQTGANWNPTGAPTASDVVNILRPTDQSTPFTIELTDDATVSRLFLGVTSNGANTATPVQATLNLNGNTLQVEGGGGAAGLAFGATNASGNISLTISGGTVEAYNLRIAGVVGTTSTSYLYIQGPGAVLNTRAITGGGNSFIGGDSPAEVHVTGGGSYITGSSGERTSIGAAGGANGNGKLFVDGAGSNYNGDYVTDIARGGVGHVEVTNGGSFTEATFNISGIDNTVGTMLISGAGSSFTATNVNMGTRSQFPGVDGGSGTNRVATLTIENGATATTGLLNLRGSLSTLEMDGSTMTVTGNNNATLSNSAAFFDAGATLRMTLYSPIATPAALGVTNGLHITNAELDVLLANAFSASVNDVFTVANYGALTGTFAGLSQNSTFAVGDYIFQIDYGSGTASSIQLTVLSVIPEPSSALLFGVGLTALWVRRRICRLPR